ncbi:chemokine XC receptor 1-like [Kryptolebias marmoratus]|uniref:chemokine XC receptor 1-like n=1 Tax=Kryptolebias marmoratus TaxID=37003 RepID=UPI0007F88701|nr:chemokine XC receptor 1-like [Kryptolebias marmoratus]
MENNYNLIDDQEDDSDGAAYICHISDFSTINGYVFILFTIISVIGNTLLICVLVTQKVLKFVTKTFILNLACSDLIFTATLPFWAYYHLHHWVFGDFLCKFMTAVYFVGLYSSIFILTGMTVDRFITVVLNKWPNNSLRKRCAVGVCVAAWVISIAVSPYDASKMQVENDSYCEAYSEAELGYYLQVSLLFFLPFAVIIFCHLSIIRTVFQATNRQRRKAVGIVFCIVAAYFICWGPYNFLLFIKSLYQPSGCKAAQRLETAYNICRILAFSHCCVNPLLCLLSQRIRRHLLDLLKVKTICLNKRQRVTDENGSGVQTVRLSTAVNSAVNLELHNQ